MANMSKFFENLAFALHELDPTHNRRAREHLFDNRAKWQTIKGWEKQRRTMPLWAIGCLEQAIEARIAAMEHTAARLRASVAALKREAAIPLARRGRNVRLPALRRLLDAETAQRQLATLLNPEKQEGPD